MSAIIQETGGPLREERAVDGKLKSRLEWPYYGSKDHVKCGKKAQSGPVKETTIRVVSPFPMQSGGDQMLNKFQIDYSIHLVW